MSAYRGNIITRNPATPTGPTENGSAPGIWTLNEAMAFKRQGIWPTQGIQGSDPYFGYVSLLLSTTSLGNANNNLFVDSSGAFNPISRNGNTTEGSFTPYSPNWGVYFNGSSTLTFAQQTLDGDFTIEAWVYYNENSTSPTLIGRNGGSPLANDQALRRLIVSGNGRHYFYDYATGFSLTGSINILPFTWTHLAVTRSGTTTRIFTNGVLDASGTWSGSFDYFCVGGVDTSNDRLNGYASNVRVVDGTAVYTANFTPPTAPLTAIAGTELLVCQSNRFRDAGPNNFALTVNGSPAVTKFSPYSPGLPGITYDQSDITNWSGYFDGSGDYLEAPNNSALDFGTGDFTIECSFFISGNSATGGDNTRAATLASKYVTSGTANGYFLNIDGNSTTTGTAIVFGSAVSGTFYLLTYTATITQNTWHHVAVVRNGTTTTIYYNGVSVASTTLGNQNVNGSANSFKIGSLGATNYLNYFNGYISNLRVVKGTAVYTSNFTPPTTNLTAISGTSLLTLQNAAFTDNSTNNFVITPNGNVTVTGNSPFNTVGYWSNYFDGSGDDIYLNGQSAFAFGTGDFTIEGWLFYQPTGTLEIFIDLRPYLTTGAYPCLYLDASGNIIYDVSAVTRISGGAVTANTWNHFALARSGTSTKLFINGTQSGSTYSDSNNYSVGSLRPVIGTSGYNPPDFYYKGYLSNIRMVKGTAVYTSNFTPPTTPLTAISGTSLLTCQSSRFIDNSSNNFTINVDGNTSIQSFDPFYTATIASNGGSMYFDGSGDYLSVGSNAALPAGNAPYTIEAWIYPTALNTNNGVVGWGTWGTNNAVNAVKITSTTLNNYWWNNDLNASFAFKINSWYHIVCQFDGTTRSAYVNGVRLATDTPTGHNVPFPVTNCTVGTTNNASENFTGYISGLKVTSGAALYSGASYTVPTTPATPAASTSLLVNGMNAGIYDATAINDMETVGNAQVSTVQSKFGASSVYFDGSGDYLSMPSSPSLILGSANFTAEAWFYAPSTVSSTQQIMGSWDGSSTLSWTVAAGSGNILAFGISTTGAYNPSFDVSASSTFSTGTWNHVALVRNGSSFTLYQNGVSVGSLTNSSALYSYPQGTKIGGNTNSQWFNGYLDDVRITNGYARYTANFTPPTQPFVTY